VLAQREEVSEIVPPEVPTADDEVLSQFEGMVLQWFHRSNLYWYWHNDSIHYFLPASFRNSSTDPTTFLYGRYGPKLSSKVVRDAAILLCSHFQEGWASDKFRELEFRGQFYNHAIEAINNNCYADIAYASYMMCRYVLNRGGSWEEISKHFSGFLVAYEKLVTSTDNDAEGLSLKMLYANLLRCLNYETFYRPNDPPDETVLDHLASGDIARLIASTSRAGDLGDLVGICEWSAEIRFQLLEMLLNHETTKQIFRSWSYPERESVLRAVRHHLRSLSRTLRSAFCNLLLEQFQVLGRPPFEPSISVTNSVLIDGASKHWISFLSSSCTFYLLSTVLFEGQSVMDDLEFPVIEAAFTICRIVAVDRPGRLFAEGLALFLAGLTLAELRLPDGISF